MDAFTIRLVVLFFVFLVTLGRSDDPELLYDGLVVSADLFESLEELARIVDISYCVGSTGIQKPFKCLGRCSDFEGFELVTTWNTGPLLSDSCGYIALSHEPFEKRVIVAFRGTYSIANTIADLATKHAEYVPYPSNNDSDVGCGLSSPEMSPAILHPKSDNNPRSVEELDCKNCTIHTGFLTSWQNTRCIVLPQIEKALEKHPDYKLVLVGHSLGGAVAAIAALELQARGHSCQVTTFGEPRIGNRELNRYLDREFNLAATSPDDALFRRVTHVNDPVPLLPLEEWGYEMHAGEIFIARSNLPPPRRDVHVCVGDADPSCISGSTTDAWIPESNPLLDESSKQHKDTSIHDKLWQLFAHRDYFWRLGLCVPIGDPWDWNHRQEKFSRKSHDNEL